MEPEIEWKVGDEAERYGSIVTLLNIEFRQAGEPEVETLDEKGEHTWGLLSELDTPARYVIQSKSSGTVGNSALFWRKGGGYGCDLKEAKRFTLAEAQARVESARGSHDFVIWDENDLFPLVEFHLDAGKLYEAAKQGRNHASQV
jgi:hypothetical protein